MENSVVKETDKIPLKYKLYKEWSFWAHLPHDTDWSDNSYKKIMDIKYLEEILKLYETIPEKMIKNCMLFIMKRGIKPTWEDESNKNGGCFSYKINNKSVINVWKNLTYSLVGGDISECDDLRDNINGITISPKKNFCVIKIWLKTCEYENSDIINQNIGLNSQGCIFKKHL